MIAAAIAYFFAAMFFAAGILAMFQIGRGQIAANDKNAHIWAAVACIVISWCAAYVGGI